MAKKKKFRVDFRKNRAPRPRKTDWTRQFDEHRFDEQAPELQERISGRGEVVRRRTVRAVDVSPEQADAELPFDVHLDIDETVCRRGRVLSVFGLTSTVLGDDGTIYQCATRRILKTLSTDERNPVVAGDRVFLRPAGSGKRDCGQEGDSPIPSGARTGTVPCEGLIERVEPRHGTISRAIRGRRQVLVSNVDQLLIVASVGEPRLKPNLIDRMLVAAEKGRVRPIICINKIDLEEPANLIPLVGVYSRMGYTAMLVSAKTGFGIDRLRQLVAGRESVVAGQSGVGKSSLLNAIDHGLHLRVGAVNEDTEKGRHTTTTARLLPIGAASGSGGFVVDTPGLRSFELWDVIPEEVAGYFRDLRPFVNRCKFPDCTHTHEDDCGVKDAVTDGLLDERRYESYCAMHSGQMEE
jgi:ribosome biogenesis GTPase / thiamine phosphate phosphatase